MKKIFMMAAVATMTAMTFTACNGGGNAKLNDDVDSLTYDLGLAQGGSLKQYAQMQLGVDSTYMDEFIKGMKEGAVNEANPKKDAYMKGLEVGKQIQQMAKGLSGEVYAGDSTKSVNTTVLLAGLIDALQGKGSKTPEEAMSSFQQKLEPIKAKNMEKQYGDWKKQNEKYLADNKKKAGVTTLKSGVQYKVLNAGEGAVPADTATVEINYEGKLIDGTEFDSSYKRNQPIPVNMAQPGVIPGWVEVLKLMPVGAKYEVTIPQDQAYGSNSQGPIKPFSTLVFTMERVK